MPDGAVMTHPVPAARLATFYFCYFAFLGAFAPFWPLYLKSVGLSAAQIGTLLAVVPVTRMFGPAVWGWLADHHGRRIPFVRFTATMTLLVFAGTFFGTSYAWLFGVIAVMNLFWCGSLPLVEATTMAHLGDRFTQYGKIRAWGSVGFVLVVVGTGQLLDFAGVRSLLWLILGLLLLHAVSVFFVTEAPRHVHHDDVHGVWDVVRRPEVLALFAGCFLMAVSHGPFHTFYSIWLVDHGYSKGGVGALWALGVLAEIIVFFTWTRLSARVSPRPMLLFAYATAAVRFLAVAWLPDSLVVAVLCQIAHAATFGCFHGAAVALTHRFFRGRHQSKGQALYSGVGFGAGGAVGGLMSGYLWDHAGGAWTFTAGAIAGLLAVGVTARWLKVGRDP